MTRNISVKQLGIVTGVAASVLVAIWYLALFSPQTHKLSNTRKADATARVQISGLQQQVSQLQSLVKEIPADRAKLAQYQQAIPSDPQLSKAIRSIQAAATNTGTVMSSLAPSMPSGTGSAASGGVPGATTIPVSISASGSYSSLMAFVQALNAMPRTLVVKSISLGGTGNTMTASLTSEIYFTGTSGS